jgi:phosphoribosylaminoimidazolecarboxamide formyltransferase/IMP cyclohydrolase
MRQAAFDAPACVIVKHANPCGVAVGACARRLQARPSRPTRPRPSAASSPSTSPRQGGAEAVAGQFVEVIIAPRDHRRRGAPCSPPSRTCACWSPCRLGKPPPALRLQARRRRPAGAERRRCPHRAGRLKVVTKRAPTRAGAGRPAVRLARRQVRQVERHRLLQGRHDHRRRRRPDEPRRLARIAAIKAENNGLTVAGSVVASDAFFPFRDGLDVLAKAGAAR